jgi:hypothetical protein
VLDGHGPSRDFSRGGVTSACPRSYSMEQYIARISREGAGPAQAGVRWSFRTIGAPTTLLLFRAARPAIHIRPGGA